MYLLVTAKYVTLLFLDFSGRPKRKNRATSLPVCRTANWKHSGTQTKGPLPWQKKGQLSSQSTKKIIEGVIALGNASNAWYGAGVIWGYGVIFEDFSSVTHTKLLSFFMTQNNAESRTGNIY